MVMIESGIERTRGFVDPRSAPGQGYCYSLACAARGLCLIPAFLLILQPADSGFKDRPHHPVLLPEGTPIVSAPIG
jgi:hypothetical protein